jgi:hypothetical protein
MRAIVVRVLIVAGLLTFLLAGAFSIANGSEGGESGVSQTGPGSDEFAVLDTPAEGDSLAGASEASDWGIARDEAQTASFQAGAVEITPGDGGICLNTDSALTCAPYEDAVSGSMSLAELCSPSIPDGQVRASGLIGDDEPNLTLVLEDGSTVAVPVHSNAYSIDVASAPVTLRAGDEVLFEYATSALRPASC